MPFTNKKPLSPSMERVDHDEKLIATIYRHPFGILTLYFQVILGLAGASALIFFIMPNFINREDNPGAYAWIGLGILGVLILMAAILFVATIIYRQSKLIITNKSITEIDQDGLFNRKISQLSVSNIEDATADRRGVFQTMLNYGILNIETAGETENFYFHYCPEPDRYAKIILELREDFLSNRERDNMEAGARYASMHAARAQQNNQPPDYSSFSASSAPAQSFSDEEDLAYQAMAATHPRPPAAPTPPPNVPASTPETDYRGPA